jgi:hypothetical protein
MTDEERTRIYQAIEQHRPLVEFLVQKFELLPLDRIELNSMDSPFLEDATGDLYSRMEIEVDNSLKLVFPDEGNYWLKKFKNYEEGEFGGIKPRRVFMDDERCDANYRMLLGLQIAMELTCELRSHNLGATIDLRTIYRQMYDYGGFIIHPHDGLAHVMDGVLAAMSSHLMQS